MNTQTLLSILASLTCALIVTACGEPSQGEDNEQTTVKTSTRTSAVGASNQDVRRGEAESEEPTGDDPYGGAPMEHEFNRTCGGVDAGDWEPSEDLGGADGEPSEPEQEELADGPAANASIEGVACDYYCSGGACNSRCFNDVLYRCPPSGRWIVEEDCGAEGGTCEFEYIDGGPEAERSCK